MRQLMEDFLKQSWFMKGIIAWGWLCILVMATSLYDNLSILATGGQ